jgi:hypothetical protein
VSALEADELSYRARALAQAHPLTPLAKRYIDRAIEEQRSSQPMAEIGTWAGAALLSGYCLRRVEETEAGLELAPDEESQPDLDELDEASAQIAADLRTEEASKHLMSDDDRVIDALDRIIASEVARRLDNWKDEVDQAAWGELEEYLTWYVVKGYALRVAETATGALR